MEGSGPAASLGGDPAVKERKRSEDGERNRQVQ